VLAPRAIGDHGPWLSSGAGLCGGIVIAVVFAFTSRRTARGREYEAVIRRTFAGTDDTAAALFVLTAAVAEELFFRLAVQDALGLLGSVAIATAVNSCVGGWRWLPLALVHAAALGAIVHCGLGLLGSTTANAVANYLNLRRIQCS
jgi:membrane protease YdiL (CAAX protease family)